MNEELKIVIRAMTADAKKKVGEVRKELEELGASSNESKQSFTEAMGSLAKGAAAAIGIVTGLTAAMAGLGRAAQEVEKGFSKLNTTFQSMGSNSGQASATYKELFSFLGEHDKAIETAQSLALITTEKKKLAEWTNILQGAYAAMGEKLPTEGLAEDANETIKTGIATGQLVDALTWMGVSEDDFNAALAQTTSLEEREVLLRNTLNGLYSGAATIYERTNKTTMAYNQSQANLNIALGQATAYTTPLLTSLNNLGTTMLTYMGPALQTITIYLTAFVQMLAEAVQWVAGLFGIINTATATATSNVSGYQQAMSNYLGKLRNGFQASGDGIDDNIQKVKELKKQTMGFDELNIVSKPEKAQAASTTPTVGGGGGAVGGLPIAPNPEDYGIGSGMFGNIMSEIDEAKEKLEGVLVAAGLAAAAFAAWKITSFLVEIASATKLIKNAAKEGATAFAIASGAKAEAYLGDIKDKLTQIAGKVMIIVGLTVAVLAFADAWANGADWANIALLIGGLAIAVTGVYVAMGPTAAIVAAVAAGIALMVIGVKDFIDNGPSLENTILIIGVAIAAALALATAGATALVTILVAVGTAVAAFTVAILLEKNAIMDTEEAQKNLTAAKEAAAAAEDSYINSVDAAENALTRLKNAEEAAGETGASLYEKVQSGTLDYADMTDAQRECYKAYIDNEKKQKELKAATEELNAAKRAEVIASYENQLALAKESGSYDEYKASVINAFNEGSLSADEARMLLEKSMSEMSDDAQKAFMKDIPASINEGLNPNRYETTRKKIGDWFKRAWQDIKNVFSDVGNWFSTKVWGPIKSFWNKSIKPVFTKAFWSKIFGSVKDGIVSVMNGITEKLRSAIVWIVQQINKISFDVPDWVPGIGGKKFGFNIPMPATVPRLAEGGIVTSSIIANIGERGREAVLPLENNTGWMDALAERIAARNNTPSKIVLQVGEREIGWATIDAINNITRQTGGVQLIV